MPRAKRRVRRRHAPRRGRALGLVVFTRAWTIAEACIGVLGALALVVAVEAVSTLVQRERPHSTAIGLVLLVVTMGVMAWLAAAKRRAAVALGSRALHADAFQATACMLLAAIALAGLGLNAAFGR